MGASADYRLTAQRISKQVGQQHPEDDISPEELEALGGEADRLFQEEKMPHDEALRIVSGTATQPYGSPRR